MLPNDRVGRGQLRSRCYPGARTYVRVRFLHFKARIRTDLIASRVHSAWMLSRLLSSKSSICNAALLPLLLSGFETGCANLRVESAHTSVKTEDNREQAPELSKERLMLSEGYSILYRDASHIDLAELIDRKSVV